MTYRIAQKFCLPYFCDICGDFTTQGAYRMGCGMPHTVTVNPSNAGETPAGSSASRSA